MDIVIGITLGLVGIAVICYLSYLIVRNSIGDPLVFLLKFQVRQKEQTLNSFTASLLAGDKLQAQKSLQSSFILDGAPKNEQTIDRIAAHHLEILNRVIEGAAKRERRLDTLPILEDLIQSRNQLLKGYLDSARSLTALADRGKEKGTPTPPWALQEYQRRLAEISDRLRTNEKALHSQLTSVIAALFDAPPSGGTQTEVTYH